MRLYHNPNCSKSRAALAILEESGISFEVIEYLKQPLAAAELVKLKELLGVASIRDFMRVKESAYEELKLADADDEALITAMVTHPRLIERPIVASEKKAVIGRPPENVRSFIADMKAIFHP